MKQTEIGMIPDDWEVKELGDICKSIASGKNKNKYPIGKFVVFGSTGIIGYTNQAVYTKPSILVARVGANAGLVNKVEGSYDVSDNTLIISGICSDINFITEKLKYRNLNKLVFGSGQPLITGGQLRDIKLSLPPTIAEQQKIAKALSDVDNVISTLEKLITKKKNLKQGTMQQLLTGKKRLPGFAPSVVALRQAQEPQLETPATKQTELGEIPVDWEVKELKDFFSNFIVPMRDKPSDLTGNIPWCRIEDFCGKYLFTSKSNQGVSEDTINKMNLKVFPVNTLLVSCSANLGKCAIVKKELITNQTFIGLVPSEFVDIEFIFYKMQFEEKKLNEMATGTTISYLSREQFEKYKIFVPSKPEQTAIANVLSSMDKEIEALNTKLEKYRNLKTGMMQQLLTGKIRLV